MEFKQRYFEWKEILDQIDQEAFYLWRIDHNMIVDLTLKGVARKFKEWSKNNHVKNVRNSNYVSQICYFCGDNGIDFNKIDAAYLQGKACINGWIEGDTLKLKDKDVLFPYTHDDSIKPSWYYVYFVGDYNGVPSIQVQEITRVFGDHGHGYQYYHRSYAPEAKPFDEVAKYFINESLNKIIEDRKKLNNE